MKLEKTVEVSLNGLDSGSGTDSFTEHAISKLRATAARMDSYRRQGFKLTWVRFGYGAPQFVMVRPGPKKLLAQLNSKLNLEIGHIHGFYLSSRTRRPLLDAGIRIVRDLVVRTEEDLLYGKSKVKGLGFHGVTEIRSRLDRIDLKLGMELPKR